MSDQKRNYFLQTPPKITENIFEKDIVIRSILKRIVDNETLQKMEPDLIHFGRRVVTDVSELGARASDPDNEPKLILYNGWGHRIDEIKTCVEWKQLHDVAATEGLIAHGYRNEYGVFSRLHQFIKLYYFGPVSAIVTCPVSMTDGAARLLTQMKLRDKKPLDPRLEEALQHFLSTDPKEFWTTGQWMTERTGGSDVGGTETIAKRDLDSSNPSDYLLTGYKFFTSATTADVAFTLARIIDEKTGESVKGSKGLSLFFLKVRTPNGSMNNITVHRLKQKFGTKPLPTAELELINTKAVLVGEVGEGVKNIAIIFNHTRVFPPVHHAGAMRRMLVLMKDYAKKRIVFGKSLSEQPLHINTLSHLEVMCRGVTHLYLDAALLMGKTEYFQLHPNDVVTPTEAYEAELLLRLLTPIIKGFTSKQGVIFMAEAIETFGGIGYMTDSGIPQSLADILVETIWEGTTNVLFLDVLRALTKHPFAIQIFYKVIEERINHNNILSDLKDTIQIIRIGLNSVRSYVSYTQTHPFIFSEERARLLTFTLARIYIASLLFQHAQFTKEEHDIYTIQYWCESEKLSFLPNISEKEYETKIHRVRKVQKELLFNSKL